MRFRLILAFLAALILGAGFSWPHKDRAISAGDVDYGGAATACIVAQAEIQKRLPAARFPSCRDNPWQVQTFANLSWLVKSSVELPDGPHKFEVAVRRDATTRNLEWRAEVLALE